MGWRSRSLRRYRHTPPRWCANCAPTRPAPTRSRHSRPSVAGSVRAVARPALPALLLATLLALWLLWLPPRPALAGQVYRMHLFALDGFSLWDNNWYGGHYLLGYSLLFPPLSALLGLRLLGAGAVVASTLIFAQLAPMRFGSRW